MKTNLTPKERAEYRKLLNKVLMQKKMTMREVNRYLALERSPLVA